ncbi:MAG: hypothetical protein LBV12_11355 [Puniceicoccales bacterium]|jgi:uncharacterized protein (DUF608 family)|nr:hypothetical protein [Puniceicoccales bacterium]
MNNTNTLSSMQQSSKMGRRCFLKTSGLAAAALLLLPGVNSFAEPAKTADGVYKLESIIPAEKNLPAEWVKSLYERGTPEIVSGESALMHVGMPVGGLFCGTVYLGGDGKLWLWDIFNDNREGIIPKIVQWESMPGNPVQKVRPRDGAFYVEPEDAQSAPFVRGFPQANAFKMASHGEELKSGATAVNKNKEFLAKADQFRQGFALSIDGKVRPLDHTGWKNVSFTGTYPVGTVDYSDPGSPVSVRLQAYSPFIPLNTEDSSLPATVMRYTLENKTGKDVTVSIGGWLDNAVCANSEKDLRIGVRKNTPGAGSFPYVIASAEMTEFKAEAGRQDVVFEDFEKENYEGWTVEGTAFADGPLDNSRVPPYMGEIGMQGGRAVVSHNVREGGSINDGDAKTGRMLSKEFTIQRDYITFLIGGGKHPGKTGLQLLIDGKAVRSATGHNSNKVRNANFDVREFAGKTAQIEIIDQVSGAWGNIIVDNIVFSDNPGTPARPMNAQPDFGSLCIALAEQNGTAETISAVPAENPAQGLFAAKANSGSTESRFGTEYPLAGIRKTITIPANSNKDVTFVLSWYFPNIYLGAKGDSGTAGGGRHYAGRFKNASEVAGYITNNLDRLSQETFLWRDTWYDSTLPYWFLDRTFANTTTLATTTSHRFKDGRFYAWEGVGACQGTCTHVWQYAQAPARLFPEIERITRERVDLGIGFTENVGRIGMRAEYGMGPAIDGQCGRIMGMWREHCMSPDGEFLKRIWPNAKKAVQYVLDHDTDGDGILNNAQENTLDAAWFGKIAWTSIEALGAWAAGERMAEFMGDTKFAQECRERRLIGRKNIEKQLFNGEYFYQIPAPDKKNNFGTYNASYIDQLFGQSMAYQCGLGEIVDTGKAKTALNSIWKYNFSFDLTDYLKYVRPLGRPYYVVGEGGTLMCTNARNENNPYRGGSWTHGYLNECMTGFEHQYASHLMHAGEVEKALAVTRVIHDRYNATKRNPYNEIECSDHYARAMASYGTFLAACGYDYNGPAGELTFAPQKEFGNGNFKAPFTVAEGWGTFAQQKSGNTLSASVSLKYGKLQLNKLSLVASGSAAKVTLEGKLIPAKLEKKGDAFTVKFSQPIVIISGQTLAVELK